MALTIVGQDAISGDMRFTFDVYQLVAGIPLVPALLGLFAVASILNLLENPEQSIAPLVMRKGALRFAYEKLMGMKLLLLWSSILGTMIGIIPGAGASISAFVAYGEAKRISKHPEEFGHGSYEGVAAPECANNAVVGGAMVPLLALGIPGSGSAAVMYGALTVHGILAGPRLFTERADVAYTFMVGFMSTVVAMLIFGLVTIRWSSLMVHVPARFMVSGVLALSAIGTYGLRNSLFDVYVLIALGVLGYLFSKLDIPLVTIALGLVLGNLTEQSYQQAMMVGMVDTGTAMAYLPEAPRRRHPHAGGLGGPRLGHPAGFSGEPPPRPAQRIRRLWRAALAEPPRRQHRAGLVLVALSPCSASWKRRGSPSAAPCSTPALRGAHSPGPRSCCRQRQPADRRRQARRIPLLGGPVAALVGRGGSVRSLRPGGGPLRRSTSPPSSSWS